MRLLDVAGIQAKLGGQGCQFDALIGGQLQVGDRSVQQRYVRGDVRLHMQPCCGRPLLSFRATWYCTTELDPAWDVLATGWRVSVDGDAPLDIDIRMPVPLDQMAAVSPGYTANRAVNSVASVCAAAPGIRSTIDLPQVITALGVPVRKAAQFQGGVTTF